MNPVQLRNGWGAYLLIAFTLSACGQMASDPAPVEPATQNASDEPGPAEPAPPPSQPTGQPSQCNGQPCEPPKQCVRYSGIAGPRVPLYACGIPCAADGTCPQPMTCRVIADGPRLCE